MPTTITIAHSPDADDAFMFYALAQKKIPTDDIEYTHVMHDIQTLNEWAHAARFDVTALSVHAYAYVADRYAILDSGASMGEAHYGPVVVARTPLSRADLLGTTIATPGTMTTAHLALQLALPGVQTIAMPFNKILPAVQRGAVAAGLLIHEGQLTYADAGLVSVLDLFRWWHDATQSPLPLGVNGIRRALPAHIRAQVAHDIRSSIEYGLAHRADAAAYARQFAGDLSIALIDRFIDMYVNARTVQMGPVEHDAITALLTRAAAARLIPAMPAMEWMS